MNITTHLLANLAQPIQNRTLTYNQRLQKIDSQNRYEFLMMLGDELREETMLKNPLFFGQTRFYSRVDQIEMELELAKSEMTKIEAEEQAEEKEIEEKEEPAEV